MALISRPHRLLFIQAPRTGCTAVARALTHQLGAEQIPSTDVVNTKGRIVVPAKHTRLPQLLSGGLITAHERRGLFVFATVRNPFDSLVSLYSKKSGKYHRFLQDPNSWVHKLPGYVDDMEYCRTHSFEEWVLKSYQASWWQRLSGGGRRSMLRRYADGVDFVMRFENLQADLDAAMKQAGVGERIEIPRVNATERSADYRSYYTARTRRIVEYAFREDLRTYGYSF